MQMIDGDPHQLRQRFSPNVALSRLQTLATIFPAHISGRHHYHDLIALFWRPRSWSPVDRLDNDFAYHAALHHSFGAVLVSSGTDGDEEKFRFAPILELDLVKRR